MTNYIVDIIIPCYNIESHISRTIQSILDQTCGDWHIIAVNDGSADKTPQILEDYAEKDKRITVLHQANRGVSSARNYGINTSNAEWIYFLDGDDIIDRNLVKRISELPKNKDLFIFPFFRIKNDKKKLYQIRDSKRNRLMDFLSGQDGIHISSCVYRKSFIDNYNVSFDEKTYYNEDREFIVKILYNRPNIEYDTFPYFNYMDRADSAIHAAYYSMKWLSSIHSQERIYKLLKNTQYCNAAKNAMIYSIIRHIKLVEVGKSFDQKALDGLLELKKKYLYTADLKEVTLMAIYNYIGKLASRNPRLLKLFLKIK